MEFSREEYWSGLPFPSPGNLPEPGIEPGSPALQADSLLFEPPGKVAGSKSVSRSVVSDSLRACELWPASLLCPWNSPGKNTGMGSHSFLQEIFLIQGSNPGLLHCRQILYCLSHQGNPILTESGC